MAGYKYGNSIVVGGSDFSKYIVTSDGGVSSVDSNTACGQNHNFIYIKLAECIIISVLLRTVFLWTRELCPGLASVAS